MDPSTLNTQLGCLVLIMLMLVFCAWIFWAWAPGKNRDENIVDEDEEDNEDY